MKSRAHTIEQPKQKGIWLNHRIWNGRARIGGRAVSWSLRTRDRDEAFRRYAQDLPRLLKGFPPTEWPDLDGRPPYSMTWKPGVSIADDSFPAGGRRRATGRVLFAQIRLPNGKFYYRCLNTDNPAVAKRRMVVVVWSLIAEARLSPTSKVAQKYPRHAQVEKKSARTGRADTERKPNASTARNSAPAHEPPSRLPLLADAPAGRAVATTREKFLWVEAVLADRELTPARKNLLTRLALHWNEKSGRCDPSLKGLADRTGLTERGVEKMLPTLEQSGWISREAGHGRGHRNQYTLLFPAGAEIPNGGSVFGDREIPNPALPNPEQKDQNHRTAVRRNRDNSSNKRRELASAHPSGALARAEEQILARLVALGADRTDWWFDAYSDEQRAAFLDRQVRGHLPDSALQRIIEKRRQAGVR